MEPEESPSSSLREEVPPSFMTYYEKDKFQEVLCKPKILPIKSFVLKRLEALEREEQTISSQLAQEESKMRSAF